MISDYSDFGDVVSFDTTFGTNREFQPFACFVGLIHHREMVIFGAALLYDQTAHSFVRVFETFLEATSNKKPEIVFTDQDAAMAKALPLVMPETYRCLCTRHMRENAIKHLNQLWHDGCNFKNELRSCIYELEEEDGFLSAWSEMIKEYGIGENNWIQETIKIKEKWARAYVKHTFTGGMRRTQLGESLNSDLRDYSRPDMDFGQFFKHFDRVVNDKRYKELVAAYNERERLLRQKIRTPILREAAEVYTRTIFQLFRDEYESAQSAYVVSFENNGQYGEFTVATIGKERKYSKNARDGNRLYVETCDVQGDLKVEISNSVQGFVP